MLKAIYQCDYGKHYFRSQLSKQYKQNEFFIFDNEDSPREIHDKIVGYFNLIRDGNIKLIYIIQSDSKEAEFLEATPGQRMIFLRMFYFNYEQLMEDSRVIYATKSIIKMMNNWPDDLYKPIKECKNGK